MPAMLLPMVVKSIAPMGRSYNGLGALFGPRSTHGGP